MLTHCPGIGDNHTDDGHPARRTTSLKIHVTSMSDDNGPVPTVPRWQRAAYRAAGTVFVGIGAVGAFVPLLPTTIFLILAAGCFARSSPKLEARLLAHPRFGPAIRSWRERRAIATNAKVAAIIGIVLGVAIFWFTVPLASHWRALAALCCAGVAFWIVTRPKA